MCLTSFMDNQLIKMTIFKTAVEMYTINSAYAMRQEKVTGSLVVGKEADLIVVDRDIFGIAEDDLDKAVVLQTVLQGEEVWRHKNFKH